MFLRFCGGPLWFPRGRIGFTAECARSTVPVSKSVHHGKLEEEAPIEDEQAQAPEALESKPPQEEHVAEIGGAHWFGVASPSDPLQFSSGSCFSVSGCFLRSSPRGGNLVTTRPASTLATPSDCRAGGTQTAPSQPGFFTVKELLVREKSARPPPISRGKSGGATSSRACPDGSGLARHRRPDRAKISHE